MLAQDGAPATTIDPNVGLPIDGRFGLQPQVTKNGEFAHWMHNDVLVPVITAICVLVLLLLAWVVFRYRRAANPVPSKTSHNTLVEVLWTLGPVVVLVLIAIPSIGLLQAQFKPAPAGAVTLKAIGNQWYWTYQYPDHGGIEITANMLKEKDQVAPGERARTDADGPRLLAVDNRIVLPVGVPIRLITTSNDVIHSWAIPAFWMKLDAVPGRLNETSFTIEKPGLYFGQCSELCGARHAFMPIAVQAVPRRSSPPGSRPRAARCRVRSRRRRRSSRSRVPRVRRSKPPRPMRPRRSPVRRTTWPPPPNPLLPRRAPPGIRPAPATLDNKP
ncbi:hypothetical protein GCM10020258_19930 [Sphingomonas yabuuchiae]